MLLNKLNMYVKGVYSIIRLIVIVYSDH